MARLYGMGMELAVGGEFDSGNGFVFGAGGAIECADVGFYILGNVVEACAFVVEDFVAVDAGIVECCNGVDYGGVFGTHIGNGCV